MYSQPGVYSFHPIPGDGWIRVPNLEPAASPDDDLKATLRQVRLADRPNYEAISYTWGQPVFPERLHIEGSHLGITENLANALRHFRSKLETRTLWADSVCINQQDNNEKAHQVSVMAEIYKSARYVLIWLGMENSDTEEAFKFMMDLTEKYKHGIIDQGVDTYMWRTLPILKADVPDKEAEEILNWGKSANFKDIYTRDWFTRLWTVQEVALAKHFNAIIHCGKYHQNWGRLGFTIIILMAAANRLGVELENMEAFRRTYTVDEAQDHYGNVEEIPMTLIMNAYQHFGLYVEMLRNQKCLDD